MNDHIFNNIYSIRSGSEWLIWAPHAGAVFATNARGMRAYRDLKEKPHRTLSADATALLGYLSSNGMLRTPHLGREDGPREQFRPTSAYILPTNKCNLKCVYCFSQGGDTTDDLELHKAIGIVDMVLENAKARQRPATIIYHGGGEPTMNWTVVAEATMQFRERGRAKGIRTLVRMVSNGIYNRSQIDWVSANVDWLALSFDGVPDVQNALRPLRDGKESSQIVEATCEAFSNKGYRFAVRSTVTSETSSQMADFVTWLAPYRPSGIEFEPLTECGRCAESGTTAPPADAFIARWKEAFRVGAALRIPVLYSGARVNKVSDSFCGAAGRNFTIAPNGFITACHRVTTPTLAKGGDFVYGSVSRNGEIAIDQERLDALARLKELPFACERCFCRWSCAGGCYEQNRIETGWLRPAPSSKRCHINKELLRFQLTEMVNIRRDKERSHSHANAQCGC